MTNFLAIIQIVVQLLPLITQVVQSIEQAMPQGGQGAQKLEMVRATLQAAYTAAGDVTIAFEKVWPAIATTVSGLVAMYNAAGTFKQSVAAATSK